MCVRIMQRTGPPLLSVMTELVRASVWACVFAACYHHHHHHQQQQQQQPPGQPGGYSNTNVYPAPGAGRT